MVAILLGIECGVERDGSPLGQADQDDLFAGYPLANHLLDVALHRFDGLLQAVVGAHVEPVVAVDEGRPVRDAVQEVHPLGRRRARDPDGGGERGLQRGARSLVDEAGGGVPVQDDYSRLVLPPGDNW